MYAYFRLDQCVKFVSSIPTAVDQISCEVGTKGYFYMEWNYVNMLGRYHTIEYRYLE